jgi:hypothetical protein
MSHEEGLQALRDGDLKTAIPLLARAVEETAYSVEDLNHAYTLALYRAGEKSRLAYAALEMGDAVLETRPALALDYFQRAFLGGLDAACLRYIGEIFERWAPPKVSAPLTDVKKIVHVIGSLQPDHVPARQLATLVDSLRQLGVESQVFTTEWASSWFFNPNGMDAESQFLLPDAVIASAEGNFLERAERVAGAIRASNADAIFYHAGFHEQITARVAAFRPGPVQVNVAYGVQMDADLFDGFILQTNQGVAAGHHSTARRRWIPPASDIADRLAVCPPNMRQVMGLESATTVSATVGDFQHMSDPKYLYVLTGILKAFPNHFHLFAGTGDVKTMRAALHEEGVLPRVRFLGTMSDTASVMAVTDVYLCAFKKSEESPLLDAMGAGRPCVAVKFPDDAGRNASAEILGVPELLVADSELAYLQVAQGLLRDGENRARCAELVQSRFESEFSNLNLARKYLEFLREIGTPGNVEK